MARQGGAKKLGSWGESVAAHHLKAKGIRIVDRNWRCSRGEIDLVARDGDVLVFVEVKTRRGESHGKPEDAITRAKADRLLQVAESYLQERGLIDVDWRVDVVAVELDASGKLLRVEQIENAVTGW